MATKLLDQTGKKLNQDFHRHIFLSSPGSSFLACLKGKKLLMENTLNVMKDGIKADLGSNGLKNS